MPHPSFNGLDWSKVNKAGNGNIRCALKIAALVGLSVYAGHLATKAYHQAQFDQWQWECEQ